jgi:hypothetical protein
MDITTFMIAVYCLIDDNLADQRLRKRGPQPTLRDSEVLTIEVVGEFLGLDTESSIFTHFVGITRTGFLVCARSLEPRSPAKPLIYGR